MNILLIGNGKWAQNYISTLSLFPNINLSIANRNNWKELINNNPNGVIVCTPPDSHIEIAEYSLLKQIPTMIEKPLSLSLHQAERLQQYKSVILVNHIHLFSTAYQNLKKLINPNKIDRIVSLGFNKGPIRSYSSLWDYGCHDLSMILDLSNQIPNDIKIEKIITETGELFNIKLQFKTFETESLVGNGGLKPIRKFKIISDGLILIYDDNLRPSNHVAPLTNALNVFIDSISNKYDYRLGLDLSLKIIKILDYCQKELDSRC